MDERYRIIVVDDDPMVLRVLCESLEDDFDVTAVESGPAALEQLRETEFAVLIADQRMPEMTGVQLAAKARQLQPLLVAVMLSAYTDPNDMIAAINEGQIYRFLRKPWDISELLLTVHQACERHALRRDNERLVSELERRLNAVEILHEVVSASAVVAGGHPADVLLDRLNEVVAHDLAGLVLLPADGESGASMQLHAERAVSEQNLAELQEQLLDLFALSGGPRVESGNIRLRVAADANEDAEMRLVESQLQVPLRLDGRTIGLLVLQSFTKDAFAADASRLLDLLANKTAEALARIREASGKQWQLLEQTLAAAPDGIILAGAEGNVLMANQAARRILELIGPSPSGLWDALACRPEDVLSEPDRVVRRRTSVASNPIEAQLAATRHTAGKGEAVVVVLRDLSAAERAEARRRDFISTLSHEIRTPLTSVVATLELLLQGFAGELNEKQQSYLQIADKACLTLNQMIDNLLDVEKFARGAVELRLVEIDAWSMLRELASRYGAAAHERELELALHVDDDLPRLEVDPQRFEQVLGNLIGNAIKFAPERTTVDVSLRASVQVPGWLVLGIRNDGEPIPPEQWPAIFDRFRQARRIHDAPRPRGTGLGLAICRSIAEAHGGSMMVESGRAGTTLWVVLPLEPAADASSPGARHAPVWVSGRGGVDRLAVAAALLHRGLGVFLLPEDEEEAEIALDALGSGICVALDEKYANGCASVCLDRPWRENLEGLASALVHLSGSRAQRIAIAPAPTLETSRVLASFGISMVDRDRADMHLTIPPQARTPCKELVALGEQLSNDTRARAHAPLRALVARLGAEVQHMRFATLRLGHLQAFKAAYGRNRGAGLVETVRAEIARGAAHHRVEPVFCEEAAIVVGAEQDVQACLSELSARLPVMIRLQYRREDRERGCVRVGEKDVPLVDVQTKLLDEACGEEDVLAAIGA